jgi:hypothetical protein
MSYSEVNCNVGLEIWLLLSIILMFDKGHVCFVCPSFLHKAHFLFLISFPLSAFCPPLVCATRGSFRISALQMICLFLHRCNLYLKHVVDPFVVLAYPIHH